MVVGNSWQIRPQARSVPWPKIMTDSQTGFNHRKVEFRPAKYHEIRHDGPITGWNGGRPTLSQPARRGRIGFADGEGNGRVACQSVSGHGFQQSVPIANPTGVGINWASSLEVAYRLMSWCWVATLIRDAPAVTGSWALTLLAAVWAHAHHVRRYLSRSFSPNTHLTGEALGLFTPACSSRIFEMRRSGVSSACVSYWIRAPRSCLGRHSLRAVHLLSPLHRRDCTCSSHSSPHAMACR